MPMRKYEVTGLCGHAITHSFDTDDTDLVRKVACLKRRDCRDCRNAKLLARRQASRVKKLTAPPPPPPAPPGEER